MTRPWLILAALLLPVAGHAASVTTPTDFIITAPPGFAPAPVPNLDVTLPTPSAAGGPSIAAHLRQPHILLRSGAGFTPGSNFSEDLERRSRGGFAPGFAPSLTIDFPLD